MNSFYFDKDMARHIDLGKQGEKLAEDYLLRHDYHVLHRNWRFSRYELDLIALKNEVLHFVEVKLRSSREFGFPEEQVSKKKFRDLTRAAEEFLYRHPQYKYAQFDILSINIVEGGEPEYFFIEDVFL